VSGPKATAVAVSILPRYVVLPGWHLACRRHPTGAYQMRSHIHRRLTKSQSAQARNAVAGLAINPAPAIPKSPAMPDLLYAFSWLGDMTLLR
jgi:hypothetical protein